MKILLIVMILVTISPFSIAEVDNTHRYSNFVFTTNYGEEGEALKDTIDEHVGKYHGVEKIYASTHQGNSIALYRAELRDDFENEFFKMLDHKRYVLARCPA